MKIRYIIPFIALSLTSKASTILVQQNFTTYLGTAATLPAGWTTNYYGDYTSTSNCGPSGPNALKFGINNDTLTTPAFSNADSVSFWIKGESTNGTSSLAMYYFDGSNWNLAQAMNPLPSTETKQAFTLPTNAVQLRFIYSKSAGNVSFDDFLVTSGGTNHGGGGGRGSITKYVKVYFNQNVDNSFSNGLNAIRLQGLFMDTIAAYINRAKYSVDIALYDYQAYSGDTLSDIATAINNAYSRGVQIRWIHDGTDSSAGLSLLSLNVPTEASPPSGGNYGIMHCKFMVVDEYDSLNASVCIGSADWSTEMNDYDYNNLMFIQSRVLARAFTNEFNIMWGDTTHGSTANTSNALFGTFKPNSGTHIFTIGGSEMELYFSPSDNVEPQVLSAINAATTDMYCSMYTYTETDYSTAMLSRNSAGVYTSALLDQFSNGSGAYTALSVGLTNFGEYTGSYIYHDKFITIDPSNPCTDPKVVTGSMNWTAAGYDLNDENTLIIHNDTIANLYLQSHAGDYEAITGKTLTKQKGCPLSVKNVSSKPSKVEIYPNPFSSSASILYSPTTQENVTIEVYNVMGQKITALADNELLSAGLYSFTFNSPCPGIYLLKIQEGGNTYVKKLVSVN